jgi:RNA polymerase sporulation-specific sigma factor
LIYNEKIMVVYVMKNFSTEELLDMSDEKLASVIREGNGRALSLLISRYNNYVRQCVSGYFVEDAWKDDLLQEGLIGLWYAAIHFDSCRGASFHTFADRCIRGSVSKLLDSFHAGKHQILREALRASDSLSETSSARGQGESRRMGQSPETIMIQTDETADMKAILFKTVSPFEKRVVSEWLEGYSYGEIAFRLDIPVKSVDNAMQRIRGKIRNRWSSAHIKEEQL